MKPYGRIHKIQCNFIDNHPQKGRVNWWEKEINSNILKKSERQLAKKIIINEIGSEPSS